MLRMSYVRTKHSSDNAALPSVIMASHLSHAPATPPTLMYSDWAGGLTPNRSTLVRTPCHSGIGHPGTPIQGAGRQALAAGRWPARAVGQRSLYLHVGTCVHGGRRTAPPLLCVCPFVVSQPRSAALPSWGCARVHGAGTSSHNQGLECEGSPPLMGVCPGQASGGISIPDSIRAIPTSCF